MELDDFLNSIGLPSSETSSEEPQVRVIAPDPEPITLSNEDYDNILSDIGFEGPPDADAEEVTEEEESEEEEEDTTSEITDLTDSDFEIHVASRVQTPGYYVDAEGIHAGDGSMVLSREYAEAVTRGFAEVNSNLSVRDLDAQEAIDSGGVIPHFNYVGTGEVTQVGDLRMDPITGEEQLMTEAGVINLGVTSVDTDIATIEDTGSTNATAISEDDEEHLIPLNSPTLLMDDTTSRFSGAEWYNEIQRQRVIIAGCGGIGSNAILQIARMTPASMVLYDDDVVETVNMAGQLYCTNDVGKSKVDAMVDMITSYTSMRNIYALKQKFDESCEAGDIMICGFDNMEARKTFYASWRNHVRVLSPEEQKGCLFLDGRLSIDTLQVFAMTGNDGANQVRYEDEFLFTDAEADATVCSMKQTTYLACMIGSVMTNLFTNFVAGLLDPIIPYDLPFFTEYDAQHMIFKTEQ